MPKDHINPELDVPPSAEQEAKREAKEEAKKVTPSGVRQPGREVVGLVHIYNPATRLQSRHISCPTARSLRQLADINHFFLRKLLVKPHYSKFCLLLNR